LIGIQHIRNVPNMLLSNKLPIFIYALAFVFQVMR